MTDGETLAEFAPTGTLRVALNHGNRVLVARDGTGAACGISVELARALADHLGIGLTFVEFERAVDVSASVEKNLWDVGFLAVDPERARTIDFTAPYVRIEGCYLVGAHCPAADAHDLVASGAPVGTVDGTAYTLTLRRKPGAETLVVHEDIHAALAALDAGEVAAIAGIRQAMEGEAALREGARVVFPPFMEIRQAMAMPMGRPNASAALPDFLAEILRNGTVGDILEAHGVDRHCALVPK